MATQTHSLLKREQKATSYQGDENVVLVVDSKRIPVHSRVLEPIDWMKEYVAECQNKATFGGNPVEVYIPDDPKDWEMLLPLLYGDDRLDSTWGKEKMVVYLPPISRLAAKHKMDELRTTILARVEMMLDRACFIGDPQKFFEDVSGMELCLLEVASRLKMRNLLPMAYLAVVSNDAVVDSFCESGMETATMSPASPTPHLLLKGQAAVAAHHAQIPFPKERDTLRGCSSASSCRAVVHRMRCGHRTQKFPLWSAQTPGVEALCVACQPRIKRILKTARRALVDKLPEILELPAWSDDDDDEQPRSESDVAKPTSVPVAAKEPHSHM